MEISRERYGTVSIPMNATPRWDVIVVVAFTLPAMTKREKTAVEAAGIEPE
jgi:hypothetical protein